MSNEPTTANKVISDNGYVKTRKMLETLRYHFALSLFFARKSKREVIENVKKTIDEFASSSVMTKDELIAKVESHVEKILHTSQEDLWTKIITELMKAKLNGQYDQPGLEQFFLMTQQKGKSEMPSEKTKSEAEIPKEKKEAEISKEKKEAEIPKEQKEASSANKENIKPKEIKIRTPLLKRKQDNETSSNKKRRALVEDDNNE